jgi:hypothetical protein
MMFTHKDRLNRIELRIDQIEHDVRSIDGRMCHLEGMARLALWLVPTTVAAITALGTAATVFLTQH